MTMRGDLASQGVRFINNGVQLFLRKLRRVHIVGWRENATARTGLDDVSAIFVGEPDRVARLIGAIDYAFHRPGFVREQTGAESGGVIAVSTGRTDGMDGHEHARTRNLAAANGVA